MHLCSLQLSHQCQVRLTVSVPGLTVVRKFTLICSRLAVLLLVTLWELQAIFSIQKADLVVPSLLGGSRAAAPF